MELLMNPIFIVFTVYVGIYVLWFLDNYVISNKNCMESEELMERYMILHRIKAKKALPCTESDLKYAYGRATVWFNHNIEEFKKSWGEM